MVGRIFSAWMYEHRRAYKQSILLLHKKALTTGLNLLLITSTLTLLVLGWVITDSVQHWAARWQQSEASIALYLSLTGTAQEEENLLVKLRNTPGVLAAVSVSAEQGLIELKKQQGMRELLLDLPSNPLPMVIHISPDSSIDSTAKLNNLYDKIRSNPLVTYSTLDVELLEQVQHWVMFFIQVMRGGMLVVSCMVLLNIGQSLRMLVAARASDIELMLRMGAGQRWIMRPFLYIGVGYGLISAGLAVILVECICFVVNYALHKTSLLLGWQPVYLALSLGELAIFTATTSCFAWIFALFFVRHYVRSIDCLDLT